ncbi:PRC-barrel domain-containing protein [Falsiroseomonas sp.]|uniref:PRC-barrel domain-containing protein n=1 Tax=Falsiroseomonas sp. TaxID=2870721 RepID=UPI0035681861
MTLRTRLFATATALLIVAAPCLSHAAEPPWQEAEASVMTPLGWTSGQLEGVTLYGENGRALGEVEAVLVSETGLIAGLAVEVGGVLGIGGREVILRFDQVRRVGDRLTTLLSEAQLEAQPRWDD